MTIAQSILKQDSFAYASKETVKMATPLVGARLTNAVNRFLGMLMIAFLGREALAAGALITCVQSTVQIICISLLYSVGVLVGRKFGEGETQEIGSIVRQGLLLGTIVAIPLAILMWNIYPVLLFFRQNRHVAILSQEYFHVAAFGVLPIVWVVCLNQFVTGISRARIVMMTSVVSLPFRLLISYVLLFGKFGFPKIGIAGVAFSNVFISWCLFLFLMIYFYYRKSYKPFQLFKIINPRRFYYLRKLFSIGWPISIQFGAELIAWSLATFMMGWLGTDVLAAQQIITQCEMIIIMIPFGIAQSTAVLVGQAVGRKNKLMTKLFGYAGLSWVIAFMLVIAFIYLVFPKTLIGFFINLRDLHNARIIQLTVLLFAIDGIFQIFDAIRNVLTGALRGFHDTKIPMWVGIVNVWGIWIPFGYLTMFVFHWGPVGLFIAALIGAVLGAIILWGRFQWHIHWADFECAAKANSAK